MNSIRDKQTAHGHQILQVVSKFKYLLSYNTRWQTQNLIAANLDDRRETAESSRTYPCKYNVAEVAAKRQGKIAPACLTYLKCLSGSYHIKLPPTILAAIRTIRNREMLAVLSSDNSK